jgi:hypothetical protein
MVIFSERQNIVPKNKILIDDITSDTRIRLWNAFYKHYSDDFYKSDYLFEDIWCNFLKFTIDQFPGNQILYFDAIKKDYFRSSMSSWDWTWWKVLDFIDFISEKDTKNDRKKQFQNYCNLVLETESSGYRFINDIISPITSEQEINEIELAIENSSDKVQTHLKRALFLLSDRQSPDFRNSIKESISAIEAQCKIICEEPSPTLTKSLEIIKRRQRVKVHSYLNEAFQKMYSWTNDDGGIRHALTDEPNLDREDAQFMLITCSAFINYLIVKKLKSTS